MVSLLGLLLVNLASVQSLALGMTAGVLMVMLASVTLLPALLGFAGRNVDRFGLAHRRPAGQVEGTVWYRWSRFVQRRPWPVFLVGLVALLAMTAPVLSMNLGFADAGNRVETDTTRRAYDLIADGFGPGFNGPLFVAVDLASGDDVSSLDALAVALVAALAAAIGDDPGVALVAPPVVGPNGKAGLVQRFPATAPQDEATQDLVHRLRDRIVPEALAGTAEAKVGGFTAAGVDFADYTARRLPQFIGAVLVLSFLLLMAVFRSLLVPLKAVLMNLLSIGAAYGVIVAVFQRGWLGDVFGVGRTGPFEAWAPIMLFAIVFGLSMDYEAFLLSCMRERSTCAPATTPPQWPTAWPARPDSSPLPRSS